VSVKLWLKTAGVIRQKYEDNGRYKKKDPVNKSTRIGHEKSILGGININTNRRHQYFSGNVKKHSQSNVVFLS